MADDIAGVLGEQAVLQFGFLNALAGMETFGDVAPGDNNGIGRRSGRSQVPEADVGREVMVRNVVETQRLPGVQTPYVSGEQQFPDTWHGLRHAATGQFRTGQPEVVARRLIDFTVAKIDDLARGILGRYQEHLRIKQRVCTGAQQREAQLADF
jgi:hypothetical protein